MPQNNEITVLLSDVEIGVAIKEYLNKKNLDLIHAKMNVEIKTHNPLSVEMTCCATCRTMIINYEKEKDI